MNSIQPATPRKTVQVHLADGGVYEGPVGAPLARFIEAAYPNPEHPIVAALVDGSLKELTYQVTKDVHVEPIDTLTNDGMRVYHRTFSFLLIVAAHELFPEAQIVIDHSVTSGGFFCQVVERELFSQKELSAIEARMREIVAACEPILKERIPVDEAIALFSSQGYDDKVRLLASREQDVTVYTSRAADYSRLENTALTQSDPAMFQDQHNTLHQNDGNCDSF